MAVLRVGNTRLKVGNFKLAQKKENLGSVWFSVSVTVDGIKAFNPRLFPYSPMLTDARHIEGLISIINKAVTEFEAVCWRPDYPDILVSVSPDDSLYGGISLDEDGNPLPGQVEHLDFDDPDIGASTDGQDPIEESGPEDVFRLEMTLDPEGLRSQPGMASGIGVTFRVPRGQLSEFARRLDREFNSIRALYAIQKLEP